MSDASPYSSSRDPSYRSYDLGGVGSPGPSRSASASSSGDESGMAAQTFLDKVIDRLEELIETETAALRSRTKIDLKDFNHRKSHGLLELSRAMRQCEGAPLNEAIRIRFGALRAKLESNQAVLKMHLEAVREISSIVADTIRDAESDGTYSQSIRSGPTRP